LPAGARETEARHKPITGDEQATVEPEDRHNEFAHGSARRGSLITLLHVMHDD
jgi:hypothetical protein